MLQIVASLTGNSRSIIYDRNMFIVPATVKLEWATIKLFFVKRVPGQGPEQRESEKIVLYVQIIIIFTSDIIIN